MVSYLRLACVTLTFALAVGRAIGDDASDSIADAIVTAKSARNDALAKADSSLIVGFDAAIKGAAAKNDESAAKSLTIEKRAFLDEKRYPKSDTMAGAIVDYIKTREASNAALVVAFDKAIAEYAKQRRTVESVAARNEKARFTSDESAFLTSLENRKLILANLPVKDESFDMHEFIGRFVKTLRDKTSAVAKEETAVRRDQAHRDMMEALNDELNGKQLVFRYQIRDVRLDGDRYFVPLDVSSELSGIGSKSSELQGVRLPLKESEALGAKPGDILEFSGIGGMVYSSADMLTAGELAKLRETRPDASVIAAFWSEVTQKHYHLFITSVTHSIVPAANVGPAARGRPANILHPKNGPEVAGDGRPSGALSAAKRDINEASNRVSDTFRAETTAVYVDDLIKRMRFAFKEAEKVETSIKRAEAQKKAIKAFTEEVSKESLEVWFRINDISGKNSYNLQITGPLDIAKGRPDPLGRARGLGEINENRRGPGQYELNFSNEEAKKVKVGDYLVLRGKAVLIGSTPPAQNRGHTYMLILQFDAMQTWSIYLDKPTTRVEHVGTKRPSP